MARSHSRTVVALLCLSALLFQSISAPAAASTLDNVAVQWNSILTTIICTRGVFFSDANTFYSQMHIAQWHALIALKNTGAAATTYDAAVAYASRAVLAEYLPFDRDVYLDPLLHSQLKALALSPAAKKLAKQIGEAVALRVVQKRLGGDLCKDFVLEAASAALDESTPAPGIYRYNDTAGAIPSRFFSYLGQTKTYVLPNPVAFRKLFLSKYKPPAVPSKDWDVEYAQLKDIGRADWPGRTPEMDATSSFWFAGPLKGSTCTQTTFWDSAAIALLPADTPLYDTVVLLSKMHVAIHDASILGSSMQWAFWFWRPLTAFRVGDPNHAPHPKWNAWANYNVHPEYPSLTTTIAGAGAGVLAKYLEGKGLEMGPFTVQGGTSGPACDSSSGIGPRRYDSLAAAVKDSQLGRMYAGHHFNISTRHGAEIGALVAEYVEMQWSEPGGPLGVIPDAAYLNVFAEVPAKAGKYSDIEYRV